VVGFIVVFTALHTAVVGAADAGDRHPEGGGWLPAMILKSCSARRCCWHCSARSLVLPDYGTQWLMKHIVPASLVQETVCDRLPIGPASPVSRLFSAIVVGVKAVKQDVTEALCYE
jgi:putative ABC transport system permease protein